MGSNANEASTSNPKNPDDWIKAGSRSKPGMFYYFNVKTNESSWKPPEGFVEKAPNKSPPKERKAQGKRKSNNNPPPSQKKPKTLTSLNVDDSESDSKSILLPDTQKGLDNKSSNQIRNPGLKVDVCDGTKKTGSFVNSFVPSSNDPLVTRIKQWLGSSIDPKQSVLLDLKNVNKNTQSQSKSCQGSGSNEALDKDNSISKGNAGLPLRRKMIRSKKNKRFIGNQSQTNLGLPGSISKDDLPAKVEPEVINSECSSKRKPSITSKPNFFQPQSDQGCKSNQETFGVKDFTEMPTTPAQSRLKRLQQSSKLLEFNPKPIGVKDVTEMPKIPAQSRLKSLDQSSKLLENVCTKTTQDFHNLQSIASSNLNHAKPKAAHNLKIVGSAQARLAKLQSHLKLKQNYKSDFHQKYFPYGSGSYKLTHMPTSHEDFSNIEVMEVEYMESEVLYDIGELRKKDVGKEYTQQPTFMDIDDEHVALKPSSQSVPNFALDTNILLSHLKFVIGLRDTILPGKGPVHLFLPWQVIHELDHLKDKGKPNVQLLARLAINYLHDNFSSKHPRVHGQKLSDATEISYASPDNNILQSCIQLMQQGYNVTLLSNDTNLRNKALICEVNAVSKDELSDQLKEYLKHSVSSSAVTHISNTNYTVAKKCVINSHDLNDSIFCEMKAIIKDLLSEVVSRGMEDELKHLWKKRTIIPPPWEADQVLHCLQHHWLLICGDFVPAVLRNTIAKLKEILNVKAKRYGISVSDLKEGLELTEVVFKSIPGKYNGTVSTAIQKLKALNIRMNGNTTTHTMQGTDGKMTETVPSEQGSNEHLPVLQCFEEAHNAAQNLCSQTESLTDEAFRQNTLSMLSAVRCLVHLLQKLLSIPIEMLTEQHPVVVELVGLIKGGSCITPGDIVNFSKQPRNRVLMENGVLQFTSFEEQLSSRLL